MTMKTEIISAGINNCTRYITIEYRVNKDDGLIAYGWENTNISHILNDNVIAIFKIKYNKNETRSKSNNKHTDGNP